MHIHIEAALDHTHNKRHIPHVFTMPRGATSVVIEMKTTVSSSAVVAPQVSLTVFDPHGARGARHCNADQRLRLTAHSATPGYTVGPLYEGVWTVWIDVHRLLEPDTIAYKIDVEIGFKVIHETTRFLNKGVTAPRGRGWYRGDLHGHTFHSDASWSVAEFVQYARDYQLDFVTLTDHNTVSPLAEHDSYSANDLLTMGGLELTTYYGHALALGVRRWLGWRVGVDAPDMHALAQAAMDAGATFIIAHPHSIGDPWCTGCDWQYPDMMPGNARLVEIWNGDWGGGSGNERALQTWYGWLNEGYTMRATAGTDIHGPSQGPAPGFNVVYADELDEASILAALRAGHAYVSARPTLELLASNGAGHNAMMGDLIEGETITLSTHWSKTTSDEQVRIIVDGVELASIAASEGGSHEWTLSPASAHWTTIEVRGADGGLRAVANPIRLGSPADWR